MLVTWHVKEGALVAVGDELFDIETTKITNVAEATHAGILRRQVGQEGQSYSCGALLGVIADATVTDEEITAFVAEHTAGSGQVDLESQVPTPQMLQVQGQALRYLAQGAGGVPILLIHGFGGDLNNWLFLQPLLSAHRATYAVDLPGHGGSSKDLSGTESLADVAGSLLAFIDQLALGNVHLVAHSMGAAIALAMAREAGDRVASLSLLSPAGLGKPANAEFVTGLISARNRRQLADLLKMLFVDKQLVSREMAEELLKFKRLDGTEAALLKYAGFLENETRSMPEALAGFTQPGVLIWGTEDQIIKPVEPNGLPDNVELVLLNGAGHMPHLERSEETAQAIRKLIDRSQ